MHVLGFVFWGMTMQTLWQDVRYGIRMLKKSPGFTFVAIATLAVAIGANAVVFSVLNGLILRPLKIPDAQGLYKIDRAFDQLGTESYANYVDLRDRNRTFSALLAYNITQVGIDTGRNPSRAWVFEVSGNYFEGLGIRPALGRFFNESDERGANSAPYLVLTDVYWRNHFQADHGVVGRVVQVNKQPFTIVGVAPPGFRGTALLFSPDFFVALIEEGPINHWDSVSPRGNRWMDAMIGHLKPGVTRAQAIADLNAVGADLEKSYPKDNVHMSYVLMHEGLGGDTIAVAIQAFIGGLMLLATLILLAACANLGSLFAARAADRSREVAVRLAIGAGRLRILRQLLTEALLVSLAGGAVGLWCSVWLLHWLSVWNPFPQYPLNMPVTPDFRVYAVALLLSVASGLLFGAVPIRQVFRTDPYQVVKSGTTSTAGQRVTARELLLGLQVAICAVLVTSSLVAVRGLVRSLRSDFGFDPQGVMLAQVDLRMAGYTDDNSAAMQKRMIDAIETIPNVSAVALTNVPPLHVVCCGNSYIFTSQTGELNSSNASTSAFSLRISPDYFRAAGTPLLAGRTTNWHDNKLAEPVAVVNETFAKKVFGSEDNAVGQYFKTIDGKSIRVIGIVRDGKYTADINEGPHAAMFRPISQAPSTEGWMLVRSATDSQQLTTAIRAKLRELDPSLTSFMESWNQAMGPALFPSRMAAASLGVLGGMGAMLSITGVFGLAAYSVSKRRRELGIRMALGAQRKEVLKAALGRAVKLLAAGSAAGLILGILASRVLASIVYQATSRDPLVLAGVVIAMALLGLFATWIPAQRALSIDPATLMREE